MAKGSAPLMKNTEIKTIKYITGIVNGKPLSMIKYDISNIDRYRLHNLLEKALDLLKETQEWENCSNPNNQYNIKKIEQITEEIVFGLTGGSIKFEEK